MTHKLHYWQFLLLLLSVCCSLALVDPVLAPHEAVPVVAAQVGLDACRTNNSQAGTRAGSSVKKDAHKQTTDTVSRSAF